MKITAIEFILVNASEKSNWSFLRVHTDEGLAGIGESTLYGWEGVQQAYLERLKPFVLGRTVEDALPLTRVFPHSLGGHVANTIHSGLEQALQDLRAQAKGVPLHALFGKPLRDRVRVYANINRRTRDRTPQGFATSAKAAIAEGYTAVKIAPFDDVISEEFADPRQAKLVAAGVERIFATRDAIGPANDLLIDCHWRFDEATALRLIRELAPAKLFWLECMVSENAEHHGTLKRVRAAAREHGVRLAGAERQMGVGGFRVFAQEQLLDVVMPDIKFAGGASELLNIAAIMDQAGVSFSPHNPSGPLCSFASLQVCAVAPAFLILEHQNAESDVYYDLIDGAHPGLVDGCWPVPRGPGIGMRLRDEVIAANPFKPVSAALLRDPRLG